VLVEFVNHCGHDDDLELQVGAGELVEGPV
jgi:hypothetical protein